MAKKILLFILITLLIGGAGYGGYRFEALKSQKYQQELEAKKKKIAELQEELEKEKAALSEKEEKEKTSPVSCEGGERFSGKFSSKEGNIIVENPQICASLTDSVTISGKARVFEAQFRARIKDEKAKILASTTVTASVGAPSFGSYKKTFKFSQVSTTQVGLLEVYDISEKDGSILDLVAIPVILQGK